MLRNESPDRQNQIVARIFSALGMKFPEDDEATEDMLAEWREALADLDMAAITARVEYWKAQGRACPADEFVAVAQPEERRDVAPVVAGSTPARHPMSPAEVVEAAKKLYSESDQTFEESYRKLGLHQRWGELPEGRG